MVARLNISQGELVVKLQQLLGKTFWLIMAASMPWSSPAMAAGWPLVEMTGKQEHIVHHHTFITVLNLMTLVVLVEGDCSDPKEYPPRSLSLLTSISP